MTAGEYDNQTNLVGKRNVLGFVVALVLVPGCPFLPDTSLDVQPDMKAIVAVVAAAYGHEGDDRLVVFPDTSDICGSVSPDCEPTEPDGLDAGLKERIEAGILLETGKVRKVRAPSEACYDDLSLPALTPVLCGTGEIGVSVSLGRFREQGDGWHVNVTVARSGLDGAFIEYVLEPADDGWTIIEPSPTLEDDIGLDEPGVQFEATIVLLESAIGDLAAIYSICENIAQDRSASRCWTKASELNPELREQICDRMLDHIDFPYEEECRLGVVWPLEY